tara:strand:+ start:215 stop:421 length:207 start_codon:yes stop_codon:yes gene_type:complete
MNDGNTTGEETELEALKDRVSSLETLVWNLGSHLKARMDSKELNSTPPKAIAGEMNEDHMNVMRAILE